MNINDPFGRAESRRQKEYESLCKSLKKIDINTRDDAQELLKKLQDRGKWGMIFIVPVTLLLALALPKLSVLMLICGFLAGLWLIKTTQKSQEYVKRYMQEELGGK